MKLLQIERRGVIVLAVTLIVYLMLAYVVLPALWIHHEIGRAHV